MINKDSLKKVHHVTQWIVSITMLVICIYYFFINKNIFKETQWLILWFLLGISNAGSIIDSKCFEYNFSWKRNWINVLNIFISILIVIVEIKRIWL